MIKIYECFNCRANPTLSRYGFEVYKLHCVTSLCESELEGWGPFEEAVEDWNSKNRVEASQRGMTWQ